MSKKKRIRPLALCVFRRGNKIFVSRGHDELVNKTFYRPIGGGIEFGEKAIDTVKREVMEEMEADVHKLMYLGTLENIFEYEGTAGHEICLLFDGAFVDDFRNVDDYEGEGTDDNQSLYQAMWKPLDFFQGDDAPPLYPEGLLEFLENLDD